MEPTRDQIREWLLGVTRTNGTTLSALAKQAGLAASTLTRFINDPRAPMIGMRTLAKVAAVAGVEPIGMPGREPGRPAAATAGLSEGEAQPYRSNPQKSSADLAIEALIGGRNAVVPWVLRSQAVAAAGYVMGDVLIVALTKQPKTGDLVCAQLYGDHGTAETVFRIYEPPYLIAAPLDPSDARRLRRPLIVDGERVIIMGVVEASLRV